MPRARACEAIFCNFATDFFLTYRKNKMSKVENHVSIGKTMKPHGLKGELKFWVEEAFEEDLEQTEVVLIDVKGKITPFFVESVRGGNAIIVKLEDVDTPEAAAALAHRPIFLRQRDILEDDQRENVIQKSPFAKCVGYQIVDLQHGVENPVGVIVEIVELPQSEMAIIEEDGREILVPLIDAFVLEVKHSVQKIVMQLPEGLTDL